MKKFIDDDQLAEILLKQEYAKKENIDKAYEFAKKNDSSIVDYLLAEHLLTKDILGQAIGEFFNVPYVELSARQTSHEQNLKIPEESAKKLRVVLFEENEKNVTIATDNPTKKEEIEAEFAEIFKDKQVNVAFSFPDDIDAGIVQSQKSLETRFSKIIASQTRVAPEIIDEIIEDALASHTSDIHFEPQEKEVVIRFRIDGVLHEVGRIPKINYENILNRIKVLSHLRVDEHFSSQDGSMRYSREEGNVDLRVSIIPTIDGEKVVIRMLAVYVQGLTLTDLGISTQDQELLMRAAKKPFGMVLVVGPTGSGKSTTLYSILKKLFQ